MLHLINNCNYSGNSPSPVGGPSVPLESIKLTSVITDPVSTATLSVLEQPPVLSIPDLAPYVCLDETSVSTPNQTHNFLCNGNLAHPTSTQWSVQSISGVFISDLSPGVQFQTVNAANASFAYELQNVQLGYIVPGQTYSVTCFETITSAISGSNAVFKFDFLDGNANILSGGAADFHTSTSNGCLRIALSGTAPANAASLQVVMGVQATSNTNSGTVQFRQVQVECQWFPNEGVSYPTPFCGTSAVAPSDTFYRANQSGWGTASDGHTWTTSGASSTQSISSDTGVIASTGGNPTFNQLGGDVTGNQQIQCHLSINQATDVCGLVARFVSGNSGSGYEFQYNGSGAVTLSYLSGGTPTVLATSNFTMSTSTLYWFKLLVSGSSLSGKIWASTSAEPAAWNVTATHGSLTAGGFAVVASTNSGTGVAFDHFSASDPGGGTTYTLPDSTCIRQTRLFAGYVTTTDAQYEGTLRTWTLTIASNSSLIDTFYLVNSNYTNSLDSTIITSSINANYTLSSLYPSSGNGNYTQITTNNVVSGATIDYLSVADQTFKDVLAVLANSSGYYYYVDPYFDLHYAPPGYEQAQFGLAGNGTQPNAAPTDGSLPTYPYYTYKYTSDGSQIKNRIKVFGGQFIGPALTETPAGTVNGTNKVFTLTYQPVNVLTVKRDGVDITSTTGVTGINTNGSGGIVALVDKAAQTITYNSAPSSSVSITYTYASNVIIRCRDVGSITQFGGRIFDSKINDTTLNSLLAADQRGLAELVQYSQPRGLARLTCQQPLVAGQSVQLTSTYDGLAKRPMLVQKAEMTYRGNGIYEWACELGAYNPDLVGILVNIHKALMRNPVQAGQVIQDERLALLDTLYINETITFTARGTGVTGTYGSGVTYGGSTAWG